MPLIYGLILRENWLAGNPKTGKLGSMSTATTKTKSGKRSARSGKAASGSSRSIRRRAGNVMPITAVAFDRLAEEGKDGRYAKHFRPISEAEFLREVAASKRAAR